MSGNLRYWLALNKVEGLGPVKLKRLLEQYGSPKAICEALKCPLPDVEAELTSLNRAGAEIIALDEPNYPPQLKNIHDPPPLLYIQGNLLPADSKAIAIVGTRRATRYGLETARKFAFELAQLGITIVSGLALGIDSAAHEGALQSKGRTIAVLGSGIDQIFPKVNIKLAGNIKTNGAVVSELPLGQKPEQWTFPQRNRIISGLSLGVIIVEGHYDSGAMITAKEALEQGREVFAVPGNVELEQSKGPHWLIKQGAKLVENVQDVLDELNIKFQASNVKIKPKVAKQQIDLSKLSGDEQKVAKVLSFEPKHIDNISADSKMPIAQVASLLMMLEIKKIVRQLPAKFFVLS